MKNNLISAALAAVCVAAPAAAAAADQKSLEARVEQLAAELEKVKAELAAQRAQAASAPPAAAQPQAPAAPSQAAAASEQAPAAPPPAPSAPAFSGAAPVAPRAVGAPPTPVPGTNPATVLTSYGEVNYNYQTRNASASQADVRRAVIGLQHNFDDRTQLVSEFEWEHAVTSAEDSGEAEVEQLWVEREFASGLRAKAGLFLMPAGLLNQHHEPIYYYGVERNFVETSIIPTTWREVGIGLSHDLDNGLSWDAGLTTGFDLAKWDPASNEGRASPLGSIHQEGQLAKARDLSLHGALNWRGTPGVLLGGFVFTGKAGQETPDFPANDARVTLFDVHGRYTRGRWDLAALYARGQISNAGALNRTFVGNPTLVPKSFFGWYLQAAYRLFRWDDYVLSPFARYERFNTANSYSALPAGLGVATPPDEQVVTGGANLYFGQGIVLKADYQRFVRDKARDRVNLGVGFYY